MPNYDEDQPYRGEANVKAYSRQDEPSDARIQAQLGFMAEQLLLMQKMFTVLSDKIEPVLLPELSETGMIEAPERKAASEISNALDDLNGQILRLQGRIERIIERVQL